LASNAINRETARDALATLINTEVVTNNSQAVAVYNYLKGRLGGVSPVAMVVSAGSARQQKGMGADKHRNKFRLLVRILVRDEATAEAAGWTEQAAEGRLDLLEKEIADVVMDNRSPAQNESVPWARLYLESFESGEFSKIIPIADLDGKPYIMEEIPVIAEMHDA
jgi:hypothetical protein